MVAPELLDAVLLSEFLTNKNGNLATYVRLLEGLIHLMKSLRLSIV